MNIKDIKRDSIDFTNEVQKHFERLSSSSSVSKVALEEIEVPASPDEPSTVSNLNRHLQELDEDFLYHISLGKNMDEIAKNFSDVRFVCMGGSPKRMHQFALYIQKLIGYKLPPGQSLANISEASDRYSMYKIGPVLSVNHGIGCPSMAILLHELIKLVHYAKCKDVTFFRLGTCGGVGADPGTLVVTSEAVDGMFRPEYRTIILGKEVIRGTQCDQSLIKELVELGNQVSENTTICGRTMCCHDFYEGQGRVDGAFCEYTIEDKMNFLKACKENGVTNIEMESLCFTGLLNHAKIKAAVVCVALVNRLNGDQVSIPHELNVEYQERPFKLIGQYIMKHLNDC